MPPGLLSVLNVTWSVVKASKECEENRNRSMFEHVRTLKLFFSSYCLKKNNSMLKTRKRGDFDFLRNVARSHSKCNRCIANFATLRDNVRSRVDGKFC